jgi:hypothetical protein
VNFVTADIDLDAPENRAPKQASEDESDIEVLRVPLSRLRAEMEEQAALGVSVWNGLWPLLAGMSLTTETG